MKPLPLVAAAIVCQNRRGELGGDDHFVNERKQASISATAAAYLNQYLHGLDVFASALSRHPDVRALHAEESGRLFAELQKEQPLILTILLTLPDGSPFASGRGPWRRRTGPRR